MFETVSYNVRYAFRQLTRHRGFAFAVILTMSLGIGLNTAMFSVVRAVLLKPLGYHDPNRLVVITDSATEVRYEETARAARSYDGFGAYAGGMESLTLSGDGPPDVLKTARISGNFLDILGVRPLLGRSFVPSEDQPGGPFVALISSEVWQRRFGGSPSIIGRSISLSGTGYTVIGVLPPNFQFPFAATDIWIPRPAEWSVLDQQSQRISPILHLFGRLKPGVSIAQANAELTVINNQYQAAHPAMLDTAKSVASRSQPPIHVELLKTQLVSDIRSKLWLLFGAVGLVLLIVCANIASLLLSRATSRSREFAVRAAIGADRWSIIAQLLIESLLLSLFGGTLGIVLAWLGVRVVRSMPTLALPRSNEIGIDATVLIFAVALSLLSGLLFGLAPALSASRPDLQGVLRGSGEGITSADSKPGSRFLSPRSLLVIGQVALSTVLLIGVTLLIESLARIYSVNPGFQVSNLLTMSLTPSPSRYDTDQKKAAFYDALVDQIKAIPGVDNAAVTLTLPATIWAGIPVQLATGAQLKLSERPIAVIQIITPQYFRTMKISLKRGREFTSQDNANSTPVVMIDETMARLFWPQYPRGQDPIGQRLLIGAHFPPAEVVGIVANTRQGSLTEQPRPGVYLSASQKALASAKLVIRTASDPLLVSNAVRNQIFALDHELAVSEVASMSEVVEASQGQLRVMMTLLGIFAGAATIITVVGLYGVISYSVVQRTKEIGIRRALGAQRGNILMLVVGSGLRLALSGLLLGVVGALILTRFLRSLLFDISPTDTMTYVSIGVIFAVVALIASYVPAQRAAKIDPLDTLRAG